MQQRSSRGVQQHEVDAAADALLAEGLRPTVERVRVKMGRGSPNTVGPMLEAWFAGLAPRLGVVVTHDDKQAGAPGALRQAIEGVWELAMGLATEQAQAAQASETAALSRERENLATARRDVEGQLSAAAQRQALLQESLDQARRQADEHASELRAARAVLQQRDRELGEARQSISALVQGKDAAQRAHEAQLDAAARERQKLQERHAANERRHLEEVDRARREAKLAHKALSEAEGRFDADRGALHRAVRTLEHTCQGLQLERGALTERVAAAEQRASEFRALLAAAPKPPARRKRKTVR